MHIPEIFTTTKLVNESGKINVNAKKLVRGNQQLFDFIASSTVYIPGKIEDTLIQRIRSVLEGLSELPRCMCGDEVAFKNGKYLSYCSSKCANTDPVAKEQRKLTCEAKYGGAPATAVAVKEKIKRTNIERYGAQHHQQSDVGRQIRKTTNESRYGAATPFESAAVQSTIKETMQSKYGSSSYMHSTLSDEAKRRLNDCEWLTQHHHTNKRTIYEIADEIGVSTFCVLTHMRQHGIDVKRHFESADQRQISQYLTSVYSGEIRCNDRTLIAPYELDIVLPELKLAVEVNGLYWHSENAGNKPRQYHNTKTNMCREAGFKLIHVTDLEWSRSRDVAKSRLRAAVGASIPIYARKCSIVELHTKDVRQFITDNHMQGHTGAKVNIGLMHQERLVAVMTFSKPRFTKGVQWEMIRYCSLANHTVVGGASKCFSHFIKKYDPESVVSYSDRRWGTGAVYLQLGFELSHTSSPNYAYFKTNDCTMLYNRVKFQKHKLRGILPAFDPAMTEWDNMKNNGYDRIWDCGNDVFVWTKK